jgi:hypothetical protein
MRRPQTVRPLVAYAIPLASLRQTASLHPKVELLLNEQARALAKLVRQMGSAALLNKAFGRAAKENHQARSIYGGRRASGGTGRRAGLRIQWGDPSEFESLLAQITPNFFKTEPLGKQPGSRGV